MVLSDTISPDWPTSVTVLLATTNGAAGVPLEPWTQIPKWVFRTRTPTTWTWAASATRSPTEPGMMVAGSIQTSGLAVDPDRGVGCPVGASVGERGGDAGGEADHLARLHHGERSSPVGHRGDLVDEGVGRDRHDQVRPGYRQGNVGYGSAQELGEPGHDRPVLLGSGQPVIGEVPKRARAGAGGELVAVVGYRWGEGELPVAAVVVLDLRYRSQHVPGDRSAVLAGGQVDVEQMRRDVLEGLIGRFGGEQGEVGDPEQQLRHQQQRHDRDDQQPSKRADTDQLPHRPTTSTVGLAVSGVRIEASVSVILVASNSESSWATG